MYALANDNIVNIIKNRGMVILIDVSPKMLSGVICNILYEIFMNIVCIGYTQKQYGDSFSAMDDFAGEPDFADIIKIKKRKILSNYPLLSNRARDRTRTYTSQNTRS